MTNTASRHPSRGSASTIVAALLALALLVATAWTQRSVLAEQRIAAQQQRAQQASSAAEAGLAWTLARLADPRAAGPDCAPIATGATLRQIAATLPVELAACTADGGGWRCRCNAGGAALPDATAGFRITVAATPAPDRLRIVASGCAGRLGACDANASAETVVAWLPPLARLPAAALAVRGNVDAGSTAIGLHHAEPASGGLALHAGGTLNAPAARITPPPGSLRADAVVTGDAQFTALVDPVAALLGVDAAGFAARATAFACTGSDCTAELLTTLENTLTQALHVTGDLRLAGPATIGRADRPLVVVVDGDVAMSGDIAFHGVLVARHLAWAGGAGPAARLHGATLLTGNATLAAPVDFIHDTRLLGRLQAQAATPIAVPGSWRDF